MAKSNEEVASREQFLNTHFSDDIQKYQQILQRLTVARREHDHANADLQSYANQLNQYADELDQVKVRHIHFGQKNKDYKFVKIGQD